MDTSATPSRRNEVTQLGNPIAWVEIPATDLDRAKAFYGEMFGYRFHLESIDGVEMALFPMSPHKTGATGALVRGPGYIPSHNGAVIYFCVADVHDALAKPAAQGGRVLKNEVPTGLHGSIAFLEDTEGNRIAIHTGM